MYWPSIALDLERQLEGATGGQGELRNVPISPEPTARIFKVWENDDAIAVEDERCASFVG
jgi:hypothetical protein